LFSPLEGVTRFHEISNIRYLSALANSSAVVTGSSILPTSVEVLPSDYVHDHNVTLVCISAEELHFCRGCIPLLLSKQFLFDQDYKRLGTQEMI
jgi:hypothetical protein